MARNILVFLVSEKVNFKIEPFKSKILKLVGAICINQISAESKVTKEKADTKIPVKQFPSNATFILDSVPVVADMAIKTTASPATTHGPVVVTTTDPPRLGFIGRIRKFFSRSYDDGISLSCIEKASSDGSMINQYFVEDHKGKRIIEPTDQIYVYTKKCVLQDEIVFK